MGADGAVAGLRRCPSCGFRGEGMAYFSRTGHAGLLALVALLTYGIGGVIYWAVKRTARICPGCGLGWDRATPLVAVPGSAGNVPAVPAPRKTALTDEEIRLPPAGAFRRVTGWILLLVAVALAVAAFVEGAAPPLVAATVVGGAGGAAVWWGGQARNNRRQFLMAQLQRRVLLMAEARSGQLTVSEVATALDLSLPAAERVLLSMDDGLRVRSEVTDDGLLVFDFPEVRFRRLESRKSASRPPDEGPAEGRSLRKGGSGRGAPPVPGGDR